jgi:hypothetical protein
MQVIHERCAALDVHKKTVVTTIMITQADGSVQEQTRTFSTMTVDLLALNDWLGGHQVEVIAMESTGVFWRPVFNLLEEGRQVPCLAERPMSRIVSGWRIYCDMACSKPVLSRPSPCESCAT